MRDPDNSRQVAGLRSLRLLSWRGNAEDLSPLAPGQRSFVYLVGAALLVNHFDLNVFSLALPQIQRSLDIGDSELGALVGLTRLGVLGAFILGALADTVGRRRMLLATATGITLAALATSFARISSEFFIAQFFVRAFAQAEEMLCFVMIVETMARDRRGWALGRLSALGAFGTGIAALLYGLVGKGADGWRTLYLIGACGLAVLVFARRRLPESSRFSPAPEQAAWQLAPLRALLRNDHRRLLLLVAITAPFAMAMAAATAFASKHFQQSLGFTPGQVATLYVVGGSVSCLGYLVVGTLADRIGRRLLLTIAIPAAAACYALVYITGSGGVAVAAWTAGLFFYFAGEMTLAMVGTELFPSSRRATAGSARLVILVVAQAIGLAAESLAYVWLQSDTLAIPLLLAAAPFSLIALLALPETANVELEIIAPEEGNNLPRKRAAKR
jgi:MFS family permease